ncbi:MAG: hydrogenase expression/formation protein HypE, partial [Candidatus Competibacterales bacterium]
PVGGGGLFCGWGGGGGPLVRGVGPPGGGAPPAAGVVVVTGDTKVVERGSADQLFITTSGVGVIPPGVELSAGQVKPGDQLLVNGYLGNHGAAILEARGDLALESAIESDCAPLHELMAALLAAAPNTRCARDATRGGLAAVLNEIAVAARVGITIEEQRLPLRAEVRGFCEILGLDPLYLANEGCLAAFVPPLEAEAALAALRAHPLGRDAQLIGHAHPQRPGQVVMETLFGGGRIVDRLVGEQLPRIC